MLQLLQVVRPLVRQPLSSANFALLQSGCSNSQQNRLRGDQPCQPVPAIWDSRLSVQRSTLPYYGLSRVLLIVPNPSDSENLMAYRRQRSISRMVRVTGVGFFSGLDVELHFHPAAENTGIVFRRSDLPGAPLIPARMAYLAARDRRTALTTGGATVEMVEHVLAALAGLQIDNCLVELNAVEPPGCDGSSLPLVQALLEAGIVEQQAEQPLLVLQQWHRAGTTASDSEIVAGPIPQRMLAITYDLDYGPRSPIRPQRLTVEFTPELFVTSLAYARTFVLEAEVAALKAQGYGTRLTERDLLIFGEHGPIGNSLRSPDECVRHKILDCIGDFALLGCDVHGHIHAHRTGHAHNHAICQTILAQEQRSLMPGPTDSDAEKSRYVDSQSMVAGYRTSSSTREGVYAA